MEQHDAEIPQHPSGESDEKDTCGPPRKRARPATLMQPMITTLLVASARNDAVEIALETDKRLKQTPLFDVPAATQDDGVVATIYSWTFEPPFEHALKGCSYFGQTKQTFEARTQQHKRDSVRNPKELGLHALWKLYPYEDHWVIQVLETRRFETGVDALAWMNEEEMRLIETHGGVLRNMDKKLKQTLNLTRGGQGDPRAIWDAMMARSRRQLSKVWPKLKEYYERNEHLRIRIDDPELGNVVDGIRSQGSFLQHADFKAWLDDRGFIYDANRAHLDLDVWPKFKDYYETNKHLRIRQDDTELGRIVNHIRSRKCFLHYADFKAWLDERGFIYDERRAHLELDVWPKLKDYYAKNMHLRIPRSDRELGSVVNHIRSDRYFLQHADFAMWLWCACFKMHAKDGQKNRERWTQVFDALSS